MGAGSIEMGSKVVDIKQNDVPKKKLPSCLNNLSFYFTEYCENTTIHGFKFLGERGRSVLEKIWWAIFVGLSLYICIQLIVSTYHKWMTSPVIVSFATSETPIWKIPFPAITVCPLIKIDGHKFNTTSVNVKHSEEEFTKHEYASLVCPESLEKYPEEHKKDTLDGSALKFLMQVSPNFDKTVISCRWCQESCSPNPIDRFEAPVLTSGGLCYTYNMLDRHEIFTSEADLSYYQNFSVGHQPVSEWNVEDGYSDEAELTTYPRRTVGTNSGLELILHTSVKDTDFDCWDSLQGYKVLIHHPARLPRFNQNYFWVPLNQLVTVAIKPSMMTTSNELRSYKPQDRKCYFKKEKILRFFKIYNQQNCMLECLSNYTFLRCGCVRFHMPRSKDTPICGANKLRCLKLASREFMAGQASLQVKQSPASLSHKFKADCECLPPCYSLHFEAETSQMDWDWHRIKYLDSNYGNETSHFSMVRIYFKKLLFMTSERSELYGQTEFWANCGGLLGLFTGFSFISLIEIIYFATLRLACNVRKFGWRYWSGAEELLEVKVN